MPRKWAGKYIKSNFRSIVKFLYKISPYNKLNDESKSTIEFKDSKKMNFLLFDETKLLIDFEKINVNEY